jgi:hypothetical protein
LVSRLRPEVISLPIEIISHCIADVPEKQLVRGNLIVAA